MPLKEVVFGEKQSADVMSRPRRSVISSSMRRGRLQQQQPQSLKSTSCSIAEPETSFANQQSMRIKSLRNSSQDLQEEVTIQLSAARLVSDNLNAESSLSHQQTSFIEDINKVQLDVIHPSTSPAPILLPSTTQSKGTDDSKDMDVDEGIRISFITASIDY